MSDPPLFASLPVCYHRNMEQIKSWVALDRFRLLGIVRFRRLEAFFGESENIWQASLGELKSAGMVKQVGCMNYVRIREAGPIYGN